MRLPTLLTAALALPLLPQVAPAQQDPNLTWSAGVLDLTLAIDLEGAPGSGYFLFPSFQTGPTPLGLVDPGNPDVLQVGLDLQGAWRSGFLDGAGHAREIWPLPDNPGLVGLDLRAQSVSFPGLGGLFGPVSDLVELRLTRLGDDVPTQAPAAEPRSQHAQVPLPDGSVLLIGGRQSGGLAALAIERFDPQSQGFETTAAALPFALLEPRAVLLANGDVLICGGASGGGGVSGGSWTFDPDTELLTANAGLASARVFHTLVALPDGTAAAIGGASAFNGAHPLGLPNACVAGMLTSVELFDPQANSWSAGTDLPAPRAGHTTDLIDGKLVVTGGLTSAGGGCTSTSTVWAGDGSGSWRAAGSLGVARAFHASVPTVQGDLLIASGATPQEGGQGLSGIGNSELLDVETGASAPGPALMGIIINGREQCIPAPSVPTPTGGEQRVFGSGTLGQPDVVYYLGGGYSSVGATAASCTPNGIAYRSLQALEPWTPMGGGIDLGLGQAVTPIDAGLRLLFVGTQGSRLLTVE